MSQFEYQDMFRQQYKLSKNKVKSVERYNWPLGQQVRMQMALLHSIQGDFDVDVDFEKKER